PVQPGSAARPARRVSEAGRPGIGNAWSWTDVHAYRRSVAERRYDATPGRVSNRQTMRSIRPGPRRPGGAAPGRVATTDRRRGRQSTASGTGAASWRPRGGYSAAAGVAREAVGGVAELARLLRRPSRRRVLGQQVDGTVNRDPRDASLPI